VKNEPKRLNHPFVVYVISLFFVIIMTGIITCVGFHFILSPHGPGLLLPLKEKLEQEKRSVILEEANLSEDFEIHRHFHNIADFPQLPEKDRPVCYICHSDYPHNKNKKVRSLLNIHTQFFVCETCHIDNKKEVDVVYKWYNPFEENPKGPFFGTSYDAESGALVEVEDLISKIAPYLAKGDQLESEIQKQDAPLAKDYMKVRDKLTPEQRDSVKNKFHVGIKPKGHECKICHSKDSILQFSKLGFDDKRILDLEQLNVKGMITKYEVFYLPNLFQEPESNDLKTKNQPKAGK
jgi:hypothetical protein